jgi:hypothetical protein
MTGHDTDESTEPRGVGAGQTYYWALSILYTILQS